jgi:hypothetical protein
MVLEAHGKELLASSPHGRRQKGRRKCTLDKNEASKRRLLFQQTHSH